MIQERLTDCQPWIRMGLRRERAARGGRWKGNRDKLYFLTAVTALALNPPPVFCESALLSTLDWVLLLALLLVQCWLASLALGAACCFIGEFSCSLGTPCPLSAWAAVSGWAWEHVIWAALWLLWHLLGVAGFLLEGNTLRPISCFIHVTLPLTSSPSNFRGFKLKIDFRNFSRE